MIKCIEMEFFFLENDQVDRDGVSLLQENDPVCRDSDPLLRVWAVSLFQENNLVVRDRGPLLRE
jgi:hypothetical protein